MKDLEEWDAKRQKVFKDWALAKGYIQPEATDLPWADFIQEIKKYVAPEFWDSLFQMKDFQTKKSP